MQGEERGGGSSSRGEDTSREPRMRTTCPMLAGDSRARCPLTCAGHKGDGGTADALVVPGINSQRVCHPGIEVCQLYGLGLGLNGDSFFRMVAWGTETSVSPRPGTGSRRGSAELPGHLSKGQHGGRARAVMQTGRSPGSSASPPAQCGLSCPTALQLRDTVPSP